MFIQMSPNFIHFFRQESSFFYCLSIIHLIDQFSHEVVEKKFVKMSYSRVDAFRSVYVLNSTALDWKTSFLIFQINQTQSKGLVVK